MNIYCDLTGRPARPIKGKNDQVAVYKCIPPGAKKNTDDRAVKFVGIREAADFLRTTAGGGIRVAATGKGASEGSAILNKHLVIGHDDGRKERL